MVCHTSSCLPVPRCCVLQGFRLVLDNIKLLSAATLTASAAEPLLPLVKLPTLVPVLGDDLVDLKAKKNRRVPASTNTFVVNSHPRAKLPQSPTR